MFELKLVSANQEWFYILSTMDIRGRCERAYSFVLFTQRWWMFLAYRLCHLAEYGFFFCEWLLPLFLFTPIIGLSWTTPFDGNKSILNGPRPALKNNYGRIKDKGSMILTVFYLFNSWKLQKPFPSLSWDSVNKKVIIVNSIPGPLSSTFFVSMICI